MCQPTRWSLASVPGGSPTSKAGELCHPPMLTKARDLHAPAIAPPCSWRRNAPLLHPALALSPRCEQAAKSRPHRGLASRPRPWTLRITHGCHCCTRYQWREAADRPSSWPSSSPSSCRPPCQSPAHASRPWAVATTVRVLGVRVEEHIGGRAEAREGENG
jgi:hypothetical protein